MNGRREAILYESACESNFLLLCLLMCDCFALVQERSKETPIEEVAKGLTMPRKEEYGSARLVTTRQRDEYMYAAE